VLRRTSYKETRAPEPGFLLDDRTYQRRPQMPINASRPSNIESTVDS